MKKLIASALLLLLTLPAAAAPHYHVTDVGPIQQEDTFAVNSHGQIVGSYSYATIGQGIKPAWVWMHGRRTPLKPQEGFECVIGCTINDRGEVAGTWATTDGAVLTSQRRAFLCQAGQFRDLTAALGFPHTEATGIDASGCIAGFALGSDRPVEDDPGLTTPRAFLLPGRPGGVQFLGPGRVEALNNRGQVVGEDGLEAVEWAQGRERKLGMEGTAAAVNNSGQILINERRGGRGRPYLWQHGQLRTLPPLHQDTNCTAAALNDAGEAVGISAPYTLASHALLWRGGHVYDLNTLLPPHSGWVLETATGINARGQIVGSGTLGGKPHAYLLTPQGK